MSESLEEREVDSNSPDVKENTDTLSNTASSDPTLSKNALKRQLKRQRWEDSKEDRRAYKKAKLKQKKEEMKANGQTLKRKKVTVEGQEDSDIKVVIDCGFDELMSDKEITSMSSQLTRCHAVNKRSLKPVEISITSLNGRLEQRMESELKGVHHRWKRVNISTDPYETILKDIEPENLIYLTADSDNVIQSLETDKVYIIGGIVDKNRHKSLCYNKAVEQKIQHGRLPIGDYIKMATRHVLTVNQVLEIMLRWLEVRNWENAFLSVIPKRKLPELPEPKDVSEVNETEEAKDDTA